MVEVYGEVRILSMRLLASHLAETTWLFDYTNSRWGRLLHLFMDPERDYYNFLQAEEVGIPNHCIFNGKFTKDIRTVRLFISLLSNYFAYMGVGHRFEIYYNEKYVVKFDYKWKGRDPVRRYWDGITTG